MNITKNLSSFRFISNNPINLIEVVNAIITNTIEKLITTKIQVSSVNVIKFIRRQKKRLLAETTALHLKSP